MTRVRPAALMAAGGRSPASRDYRPLLLSGLENSVATATMALLVARPFYPSEAAAQGDGVVAAMLWLVVLLIWAVWLVASTAGALRTSGSSAPASASARGRLVTWGWTESALAACVVWHSVAGVVACWQASPRPALNLTWEWVSFGAAFFLARQTLRTPVRLRAALVLMVAVATAIAVYGVYQYFVEMPATRALYWADPDAALRAAGQWYPPGSVERALFEKRLESLEPMGTFALTNSLAGLLTAWLLVSLGMALLWRPAAAGWTSLLVSGLVAVLLVACLLLTKSRAAYLASLLGGLLLVTGVRTRGVPRRVLAVAGAIALIAFVLAAALWHAGALDRAIFSEAAKSLGYRWDYWRATVAMVGDHPWLGIGPGNFQDAYLAYKLPAASEDVADPHNFLLEVASTAGLPAAAGLVLALTAFAVDLRRGRPVSGCLSKHETGSAAAVWAGGGLGLIVSLPLAIVSSAPPGLMVYLVGVPVGVAVALGLRRWVRLGQITPVPLACAVAALLLNLLVAGGISYAGVVGSLWLLIACGLNLAEAGEPCLKPTLAWAGRRHVTFLGALAVFGAVALAAWGCYRTAYAPVLHSQQAMAAATSDPPRRAEWLHAAAAADPWDALPREELTAEYFQRWLATRSPKAWQEFERWEADAKRLAPRSATAKHLFAQYYALAYRTTGERNLLGQALSAAAEAVRLYPTHAGYHAELAQWLWDADQKEDARLHARVALELDRQTPHEDRKLTPEQREKAERIGIRRL